MADPNCPDCEGRGWIVVRDVGNGSAVRCSCEEAAVLAARLTNSGVPERFRESTFPGWRVGASIGGATGERLAEIRAIAERYVASWPHEKGLMFVGPPGCGKTNLACCTLLECIRSRGVRGLFLDFTHFMAEVKRSYDPESGTSTTQLIARAGAAELLVLDELGAQKPTDHTMEVLYLVLSDRYLNRRPTIFTTNFSREERPERPGESLSSRVSPPILSRLYEMASAVSFPNFDYRREVARFATTT